ncbi:MAG: hypothetical protein AB8B93_13895 [Pseudomonadales bacterium]
MSGAQSKRFPLWFWLLWAILTTAFFGFMQTSERGALPDPQWQLNSAEVLFSDDVYPPAADAEWQTVALPFVKAPADQTEVIAWMRLEVPATAAGAPLTLAIPSPNFSRYSLWRNGREIDQRGMEPERVSLLRLPIAFAIPPESPNTAAPQSALYLRINSQDPSAYWQPMLLGPTAALQDYQANAEFMQQTLVRTIMAMMAVMSFLMAIIHRMRFRKETVYGWYALGMFAWLLHTGQGQLQTAPFAGLSFWLALGYVTLPTFVVLSAIFTNRVIDRPQPRVERALLVGLLLGAAYIFYRGGTDDSLGRFLTVFWIPATIVTGMYNLTRMIQAARHNYAPDVLVLLAATAVVLVVGVRDYLYNNLGLIAGSTLYLKYAAGLVLVVFSFVLIRRFSNALTRAEQTNTALQAQQQSSNPDSGADYRRVLLAEHHLLEAQIDQLLDSVASSEKLDSVRQSLNAARDDMQLITDALAAPEHPAQHLLTSLAQRLQLQAKQHQSKLHWDKQSQNTGAHLKPHQLLSLARFIQMSSREAFATHATIKIVTKNNGDQHQFILTATGPQDPDSVFKRRLQYARMAAELEGQVRFRSVPGGCEISLLWEQADQPG